jgi:hydrogenase-4 component E
MDFMELLSIIVMLCCVMLCATGRLKSLIRAAATQGAALGLLAFSKSFSVETCALAAATILVKAVVFPYLLNRALEHSPAAQENASALNEPKPYVGYNLSLAVCALMLGLAAWLSARLSSGDLLLTAAFFTILTGFFLLVSRKSAYMQAIGYLVLEGGIYLCAMGLRQASPLLVELGLMLDVLMAVFIMGLMIYQISNEFDHADIARLSNLSDAEDYD